MEEIIRLEDLPDNTIIEPGALKIPRKEVPLTIKRNGKWEVVGTARVREDAKGLIIESTIHDEDLMRDMSVQVQGHSIHWSAPAADVQGLRGGTRFNDIVDGAEEVHILFKPVRFIEEGPNV